MLLGEGTGCGGSSIRDGVRWMVMVLGKGDRVWWQLNS